MKAALCIIRLSFLRASLFFDAAARLAQHRVQFIQQILRHRALPTETGPPAGALGGALRRQGQRHGLRGSGRGRGRAALGLANTHRASSARGLQDPEEIGGPRAVGCCAWRAVETGGRGVAIAERDFLCQLWANKTADGDELQSIS